MEPPSMEDLTAPGSRRRPGPAPPSMEDLNAPSRRGGPSPPSVEDLNAPSSSRSLRGVNAPPSVDELQATDDPRRRRPGPPTSGSTTSDRIVPSATDVRRVLASRRKTGEAAQSSIRDLQSSQNLDRNATSLIVNACGHTFFIAEGNSPSLSVQHVQKTLQDELRMQSTVFELYDRTGTRLRSDLDVQEAVRAGRTPLHGTCDYESRFKSDVDGLHQIIVTLRNEMDNQKQEYKSEIERLRNYLHSTVEAVKAEMVSTMKTVKSADSAAPGPARVLDESREVTIPGMASKDELMQLKGQCEAFHVRLANVELSMHNSFLEQLKRDSEIMDSTLDRVQRPPPPRDLLQSSLDRASQHSSRDSQAFDKAAHPFPKASDSLHSSRDSQAFPKMESRLDTIYSQSLTGEMAQTAGLDARGTNVLGGNQSLPDQLPNSDGSGISVAFSSQGGLSAPPRQLQGTLGYP